MCNRDCVACNSTSAVGHKVLTDPKDFPCNKGETCENDYGMGYCLRLDNGMGCIPYLGVHEINGEIACTRAIIKRTRG